jgi:hypothetical protein
LFVEDPSVFLSVPPPPPSSSTSTNGVLPMMLPSTNASNTRVYANNGFGSFNMQSWNRQQPYLPSITNQQQQDQSKAILLFVFFMCI